MSTTARQCTEVYRCQIHEGQQVSFITREISVSSKYEIKPFKSRDDISSEDIEAMLHDMIDRARECRPVPYYADREETKNN